MTEIKIQGDQDCFIVTVDAVETLAAAYKKLELPVGSGEELIQALLVQCKGKISKVAHYQGDPGVLNDDGEIPAVRAFDQTGALVRVQSYKQGILVTAPAAAAAKAPKACDMYM